MKKYNIDNPIFTLLSRCVDIVVLNVLWIIFSIPMITIGGSTTALYYCMLKIVRGRDSSLVQMFFQSFKSNLKQGIGLTVSFILVGIFLYIDIWACRIWGHFLCTIIMWLLIVIVLLYFAIIVYSFPILAQFENTNKNIVKNAFLMSMDNMLQTFIVCFLEITPWLMFLYLPEVFLLVVPLWIFFLRAGIAYLNARVFSKIFDKYIANYKDMNLE